MAIGDISLSSSTRANLSALQNTAKLLEQTQQRLSTGKKVNSALDNATSYFASKGFLNSANDLSNLKDSMATGLETITAATDAIDSIETIVEQLQSLVSSASQSSNSATRAGYAEQYNALLTQLDALANDATFNGTNLVNSLVSQLKISFNSDASTYLTVQGENLTSSGLGIGQAQGDFASTALAKSTTITGTVTSTTTTVTGAYTGTFDLTDNVTGATADDSTAQIVSNSQAISTSVAATTALTDGATTTITQTTYLSSTALLTAFTANMDDVVVGDAMATGLTFTYLAIQGQYTADAAAGTADLDTAAGTLTSGGDGDITLTVAAGDSIQVNWSTDSGATAGTEFSVFTNTSSSAITITLHYTDGSHTSEVSVGTNGTSNSTLTYMLATGTVANTDVALSSSETLSGSQLVDAGGATTGTAVTAYATSDGTGMTEGTTTATGVTAYDISDGTISIDATSVKATKSGTAAVSYAFNSGSDITVGGVTQVTGSTTVVVESAVTAASDQLTRALTTLRTAASSFGNNNTLVQTREDFTDNMISTLESASDNLILADTNEEGANMQTLQAQDSLGIVSLSISGSLAQAILKLF